MVHVYIQHNEFIHIYDIYRSRRVGQQTPVPPSNNARSRTELTVPENSLLDTYLELAAENTEALEKCQNELTVDTMFSGNRYVCLYIMHMYMYVLWCFVYICVCVWSECMHQFAYIYIYMSVFHERLNNYLYSFICMCVRRYIYVCV